MYFKNLKTGVTWHITNKSHQKRLQADSGYLEVSDTKVKESKKEPTLVGNSDTSLEKTDIKKLKWNELRSLASEKGINTKGVKREDIEAELIDRVDANDQ